MGDLNADGFPDAVVTSINGELDIALGTGAGAFASAPGLAGPWSSAVARLGRFDADAHLDMLVAGAGGVVLLAGDGTGAFPAQTAFAVSVAPGGSLDVGDFNGDGHLDFAAAGGAAGVVAVRLGDGAGSFGPATTINVTPLPQAVEVADMNVDGDLDLVVRTSSDIAVLLGDGTGAFAAPLSFALSNAPQALAIADLDADGDPDLAVATGAAEVSLLSGNGTGTLQSAGVVASTQDSATGIAIADVNGDGRPDLVVTGTGSAPAAQASISLIYGTGPLAFTAPPAMIRPAASGTSMFFSPTLVDVSGDGEVDLMLPDAGNVGPASVILNR